MTFRWELGKATPAAHETGIKLEKQFYVLVVINTRSVRLVSFPGSLCAVLQAMKSWVGPGTRLV